MREECVGLRRAAVNALMGVARIQHRTHQPQLLLWGAVDHLQKSTLAGNIVLNAISLWVSERATFGNRIRFYHISLPDSESQPAAAWRFWVRSHPRHLGFLSPANPGNRAALQSINGASLEVITKMHGWSVNNRCLMPGLLKAASVATSRGFVTAG